MKDNFSNVSALYAQFRPTYPRELYDFILSLVSERQTVWDCGTGNGQVSSVLSDYFDQVFATDISGNQISQAVKKKNIYYSVQSVEHTSFNRNQFDLIIAAQAAHWFDFPEYFREVDRTLKRGGILALVGYSHVDVNEVFDGLIRKFKSDLLGSFWDNERKIVDERYSTIPFPYRDIPLPKMAMHYRWTLEQLVGYLRTWSAVQHYTDQMKTNPVEIILPQLMKSWGDDRTKEVTFNLFARVGKKI